MDYIPCPKINAGCVYKSLVELPPTFLTYVYIYYRRELHCHFLYSVYVLIFSNTLCIHLVVKVHNIKT